MSDRPLPSLVDPLLARAAFERHAPAALEGLSWHELTPLSIAVDLEALRADGERDRYVLRLDFAYYPDWPPRATFLDPATGRPDPSAWPRIEGAGHIGFHPTYGDAEWGMVCNSMFFEYYFWGGHSPDGAIAWKKDSHTFAASINVLRDVLQAPFYKGPSR